MFLILALAVVAFWFMSRRTRKQQAAQREFRNELAPGDEVMTASGMIGTVVEVAGDRVTLEAEPGGGRTQWVLAAIAKRMDPPVEDDVVDDEDVDDDDAAASDADRIARANDAVIDVPNDLSSLDKRRDDDTGTSK
ncbi:preprotein translocase subunit YajC [Cellulomonas sp. DKR-3]|uniref:Preprotein translocase subunit YajC n=2 Tax=Cellulomonas fulva TaxID=2835530 RepID=A0ABS5U125_9CELL|nr:preprotein translocase subunit YajC [Cellulomonas fulva]